MSKTAQQKLAQAKKPKSHGSQPAATFSDHITELRRRLMWVALFFGAGSLLAYNYRKPLLDIILAPLNGQKLVYLTPGGGFSFIFQISIYAGLIVAAPMLLYQLHAFVKPALPVRARHSAVKVVLAATGLVVGGVLYGYFVAIPAALHFLMTFAEDAVTPNLTADSYLSFFLAYVGGLALLSLLPLLLVFWHWINPLTPGGLFKSERWVIVFAFVAAAIITPTPDMVNQTMIAAPIIGIYQLGTIVVLLAIYRDRKTNRVTDKRTEIMQTIEHRRQQRALLQPVGDADLRPNSVLNSATLANPIPDAQPAAKAQIATLAKPKITPANINQRVRTKTAAPVIHVRQPAVSVAPTRSRPAQPVQRHYVDSFSPAPRQQFGLDSVSGS